MRSEQILRRLLQFAGLSILIILIGVASTLLLKSMPTIKAYGLSFFISDTWDPVFKKFGALPFLAGTLLTSFLATLMSIPFSIAIALLLGELLKSGKRSQLFSSLIELLAGIPSVVYGFWGLLVLVPLVRKLEMQIGVIPYGIGILAASIILAIMIVPYSASLSREMIRLVPNDLKEAAIALGATRYEVIRYVILPYAKAGIFAGFLLALGRALGETMAVTMLIGNSNYMPKSIFAPGNTMASVIANEFAEATETIYLSALVEIGLTLFLVTVVINMLGRYITKRLMVKTS